MSTTTDPDSFTNATAGQIISIEKCNNKNDNNLAEIEIERLFQEHKPFKLQCFNNSLPCDDKNAPTTITIAQLVFPTTEQAERVFAMFDDHRVQLRYDFSQTFLLRYNKNFATCYIQGIPVDYDLHIVYSAFRKFGPVYKCQRLTPPSKIVMVHYYSIKHRDQALEVMNDYSLPGDIEINVVCSSSLSPSIKVSSKKKRPVNLQIQHSTIINKNKNNTFLLSPSSTPPISSPLSSPTIVFMNTTPSQHYLSPYYYIPTIQQHDQQQQRQTPSPKIKLKQPSFEIKPTMDLCNLYIKGIHPGLTSTELFNVFKPFGRIISARVMEDNNGGSNTVFGFVSFSSSIEAAKALIEMHVEEDEKKKSSTPIMTVRFHEPRVPRPEHNYSQQIALLSNSSFGPHFYTRQKQKMVPLQPMEDESLHPTVNYSPAAVIASPTSPSYFPPVVNNNANQVVCKSPPSYYYYPSYWQDHHGVIYTNFVTSQPPPPSSPRYHQQNNHSYNNKKQYQQRHSWSGGNNNSPASSNLSHKLMELLETEYNITSKEEPELVKKLLKLNRIEQSNCLNNSVYFKKKISLLMTNNEHE